jgi:outer membrane protein OmpA-like peptidoglycan-associated protein
MRNILSLTIILLFTTLALTAQNENNKAGISFKKLYMDYQSQNGGEITAFKDYDHGFEIGYHRNLMPNLNLIIPLKTGIVRSHTNETGLEKRVFGLDAQVQYQFLGNSTRIIPYAMTGIGGYGETEGMFNIQVPLSAGINFKITPQTFVNIQSEYRISFSDGRNNLQHGLGFVYLFGNNDKEPVVIEEKIAMNDSDGDGVIDELDLCPQLAGPKELKGCPDTDGDGIADYEDKCPLYKGTIELRGCPDSDGDGISDNEDECPNLAGPKSNKGCPAKDSDNDGVPDDQDKCPDEPGLPSKGGCPDNDSDGDGIANDQDKCPNEAGSAATEGCPDSDGDGVADRVDKCPNSPGIKAYNGCPDTDGDGIDDSRDKCPDAPGPVANMGCPEIKKEDKEVLDFAMRAVQFDSGKATLKVESYSILDQVADILGKYPNYNLAISGHTDNTGTASTNQVLSEKRAQACYTYLAQKGISTNRMSFAGYGESRPISGNDTLRGRLLNRRVEFNLIPR